jgi:hypothetical protein
MRYHYYFDTADRFANYREIRARHASTGACGHAIHKGELIGWNPRVSKAQCAACWARWAAENAEADAIERGYMPTCL